MRLKRARWAVALAAALPLSGCAAMLGGYDLAPSGLPRSEDALRRDLATRAPVTYRSMIDGERALPDDDLLRLLYAALAGRYAGAYDESSHLLDVASYLAEDRVTTSVSRQALSLITNDRALAYVPGRTERLMIPYTAAVDYLSAGDPDGAAVEARRIEALLDRFDDGVAPADVPAGSRFLHYFAGTVFEAAHDWNAADVAYRRARPMTAMLRAPADDGAKADSGAATLLPGEDSAGGSGLASHGPVTDALAAGDSVGEVVVLVEHGFVPHRVEQSVIVVVPSFQMAHLTGGSIGERAAVAAEAATRLLVTASQQYGDRSGFYRDPGYQRPIRLAPWRDDCGPGESRCDGDSDPYLLRISWPVLYQEPAPAPRVRVRAGEYGADAVARFDLAESARADFAAERATIVARTMLRAVAKVAVSAGVKEAVSKKDEVAGDVAGLLTNLGTMLTERADTRCWQLLPGSITMVRLRLPAGTHELTLEPDGPRDGGRVTSLGAVTVRPGGITFVATRQWR